MLADNRLHKIIHTLIRNAPAGRLALFRLYNLALSARRRDYLGRTYFGAQMDCNPRDLIQQMILHFGVWEPGVSAVIERELQEGDAFLDVGANVGYDTLLAAHRVGQHGAVVAIEASPRIFVRLEGNIRRNGGRNIRAVNMAASDAPGRLDLYAGPSTNTGQSSVVFAPDREREATVDAIPIDLALRPDELARLRLIKIDIEGAELPVMRRFIDTIDRFPPNVAIIVEAAPSAEWEEILTRMHALGSRSYEIENSYDRTSYIAGSAAAWREQELTSMPPRQIDIFFTRAVPASASSRPAAERQLA